MSSAETMVWVFNSSAWHGLWEEPRPKRFGL